MKHENNLYSLAFCLVLILGAFQSCKNTHHLGSNLAKEKETLLESVEAFNQAFKDGEHEKLEKMITNNYLHTNGNSKSITAIK